MIISLAMINSEIHWLMVDTDTFIFFFREKGNKKKIEKNRLTKRKTKRMPSSAGREIQGNQK